MKKLFQKILVLGVLALAQVIFLTTAQAGGIAASARGLNQADLYGYNSPGDVRCDLFDKNGVNIGHFVVNKITSGPLTGWTHHEIALKDGSKISSDVPPPSLLPFPAEPCFPDFQMEREIDPLDQATQMAFPELGSYMDYILPGDTVKLLYINGNHLTPAGQEGVGPKGSALRECNYVEVRCIYLEVNGEKLACLGCHFFCEKR